MVVVGGETESRFVLERMAKDNANREASFADTDLKSPADDKPVEAD